MMHGLIRALRRAAVGALAAALLSSGACATAQPHSAPAIAAKRDAILAYLGALGAQRQTLSGVQVNEYEVYIACTSFDRVREQIGARPAVLGLELMFAIEVPPYRAYLTDRALAHAAEGGLVTLTWHHRNPLEVCPRGEYYECAKKPMTEERLRAMVTPGTGEHALWRADVDAIAVLLRDWRARGLVVLFRPYHEMNGDWFWWGRKDAYPELWDALYDELAIRHGLDNLIWVWAGDRDTPNAQRYYPRRHRPDIVGIDVYENDPDSPLYAAGRASVTQFDASASFALTEVGRAPSAAILDAANPAWVLLWGGEYLNAEWAWNDDCPGCNSANDIARFFALPRTLTLEETPAPLRAAIAAGVTRGAALAPSRASCPARLH